MKLYLHSETGIESLLNSSDYFKAATVLILLVSERNKEAIYVHYE